MSGNKFLHKEWVNRTSIPAARRFIEGHHCTECGLNDVNYGGRWKDHRKALIHGSRKEKKIDAFSSNYKPPIYNNDMYDQPYIMKKGYHCRKFLLRNDQITEYLDPILFEKPYYIDRINQNGDIHAYYLSDGSKLMGIEMAKKFEKSDIDYSYDEEKQWVDYRSNDEAHLKKKQEWATKRALEKEHEKSALQNKIRRDEALEAKSELDSNVAKRETMSLKKSGQSQQAEKIFVGESQSTVQRTSTGTPISSSSYSKSTYYGAPEASNNQQWITTATEGMMTPKFERGSTLQANVTPMIVRDNIVYQPVGVVNDKSVKMKISSIVPSDKLLLVTTPFVITTALATYFYSKEKLEKERQAKLHEQKKCEEQRLGRTRAERELRRTLNDIKEDRDNKSERPPDYPPIGFLECCFRERNGTPRQGCFVTKGRAILRLRTNINPAHALEGLDQYSHCWLIFVFHENTNTLRGVRQDRPGSNVKAKVKPPKLDGVKVGLFSTRTPHRPNAIGLSTAKIDKIVGNELHLSCIDLIDGTPILDVKPYIKHYDSLPDAVNPAWTLTPTVPPLKDVIVLPEACEQLKVLVNRKVLKFYDNFDDIHLAIKQVLVEDIRSIRKRKSDRIHDSKEDEAANDFEEEDKGPEKHRFCIDTLNVKFTVEDQIATVFEIELDVVLKEKEKNIYLPSSIYVSNGEQQKITSQQDNKNNDNNNDNN
ncbi:hypothetical protein PPL_11748 [Heterostelium album PN500]|uniref:TsaA-like domain-containing protein n=1 Tax=Heterostelium pallidum (strain ATCC 26659 / Pp 5 / PN500) TaxID=670386 RepID=D3BUC9_HETP5|nr:hypothetical protein PPL_11748 [Heterostelium album PN500]EFA74717.1 hypothetical protein PPL_11748 [Heterostelium album PN500]|eukprot:XP_020426851.1 hypothetical protein PPL_11748 [Heterostelium album PN500]